MNRDREKGAPQTAGGMKQRKSGSGAKPVRTGAVGKPGKSGAAARPGKPNAFRRPGGRPRPYVGDARKTAYLALADVMRRGAYTQLALNARLRSSYLRLEDKQLATAIFYSALENRLRIAWHLERLVEHMPNDVVEDILHIAAAQLLFLDRVPDHAAVDEAVKQAREMGQEAFAALVNGTLRSLIRARDAGTLSLPEEPEAYRLSIASSTPRWLVDKLAGEYGFETARALIDYRPDERTVTIRPNLMQYDSASFSAYLDRLGLQYRESALPCAFRISGGGDLAGAPGFRSGEYSLMSEGSMLAALAVRPERGWNLLDACAAPGGKSCLLAELLGGSGRVFAWELHENRAELIRNAKKRLRLDNLRVAVRDASVAREDSFESFDAVLVDAPCSGLGVAVSKPDIKYRVTEEGIQDLCRTQARILDACARYPRPGGALVYSTCSILPEENEKQIAAFLERHPEYLPDPDGTWLPQDLRPFWQNGRIQLLPHRDGMEGFFIARLRRLR